MTEALAKMTAKMTGCEDYERKAGLSRRQFLTGMAATTGGLVSAQMFGDAFRQTTFGAVGSNILVVISFRGGIDGLGMVVPHGDADYYKARPNLSLAKASLVAQDAMFGMHPAMKPLEPMWNAGQLAGVHAVGLPVPNRSHFEAMELIEEADPQSSERRGWLNRMIGLGGPSSPTEAVHLSSYYTPTLMMGPAPSLATQDFARLSMAGVNDRPTQRYGSLDAMWAGNNTPLGLAARSAITISQGFATTMGAAYTPANGAVYPTAWPGTDFSKALKDTAHLIRANLGTQVVSIDFGSWDMHADYGTQTSGQMQSMTAAFAGGVAAFFKDLGTLASKVTLVTISEFGRRVQQNGNRGLDHGWGNMMLVMGGGVKGGKYYGSWPWLAAGKLVDGDLKVTTDYRNVLGEVVTKRFPDRSIAEVFPGLGYTPLGLMS